MGALGGSRTIYGAVYGRSEQEVDQLRERFVPRLATLPVCASAGLGQIVRIDAVNLVTDDWERTIDISNLEQDCVVALADHAALLRRAESRVKKPIADD